VKLTVYLPDKLAAEVDAKLSDSNISAICQDALRAEVKRVEALAKINEEGFERVELYDRNRDRFVAFQGQQIGYSDHWEIAAYLTPKGAIAVYEESQEWLNVYSDYDSFIGSNPPGELATPVAAALGEKYVEELDI
jgi:hypothetical protein